MSSDTTIDALTKSVNGLDASRRVGWARAYAAAEREDEALRDLNVSRGDLELLKKYAAYALGQLRELRADARINLEYPGAHRFLPADELRRGQLDARQWLRVRTERAAVTRAREKALRQAERQSLSDKFGFPDELAMLTWLAKYEGPEA